MKFVLKLQKVDPATKQKDVSEKMRQILIDWLVDVHESFELKEQTLHLALSYLSDYSALKDISKDEYQLVGITCLWIASKYEEIYPPRTRNYIEVTADSYSLNDLKRTEGKIIEALDFNLNRSTSLQILEAISESIDEKSVSLCKYLLEYSIFTGLSKDYTPSTLVTSALSLCESIFKIKLDVKLPDPARVPKEKIVACFKEMCSLMESAKNHDLKAIKRKYMKGKYQGVSKLSISIE